MIIFIIQHEPHFHFWVIFSVTEYWNIVVMPTMTLHKLCFLWCYLCLHCLYVLDDMSLPANMLQLVTAAGALVLGFIGVAVVLSLILPLFGVRFCNLVGTCDHFTTTAYSGTGMGHNYDAYSTAGTYNQPSLSYATNNFQKR